MESAGASAEPGAVDVGVTRRGDGVDLPPPSGSLGSDRHGAARDRGSWRRAYERSVLKELFHELGEVGFGDRIILFGAALLLSVLPLIILLSALASSRVDDDISQRLGLNRAGTKVMEGMFTHTSPSFNIGILVSLVLSFAGTIAVARSVQVIYERAYGLAPSRGMANIGRCLIWVVALAGIFFADGASAPALRDEPAGWLVLGVANFVGVALFFWWTAHFLLGGRESWRRVWPVGFFTALFWMGLGLFASFYFSSTVVSDNALYGTIGVVFTLVTWFIAIGAVLTLGAVVGVLWLRHHSARKCQFLPRIHRV